MPEATPKLPADLELYSMWSARLGLTPIVDQSVETILRNEGGLIFIPGQRSPHVSAAVAMSALERFCARSGVSMTAMQDATGAKRWRDREQSRLDKSQREQLKKLTGK